MMGQGWHSQKSQSENAYGESKRKSRFHLVSSWLEIIVSTLIFR
jgi:hypothetical protein